MLELIEYGNSVRVT